MSKLRRDLRLAMAGACSGLFSVSVYLLLARVVSYYEYLSVIRTEASHYYSRVEDLWWTPIVVWHVVLSIGVSLIMHRYLPARRVSSFLRWQAIGGVVLAGWILTMIVAIAAACLSQGSTWAIQQALNEFKLVPVGQFVAAVFASHVFYGSAIQVAATESLTAREHVNQIEA